MIKLIFIVNDYFLATHIISNYSEKRFIEYIKEESKKDVVAFQNLAYEKSKELYMFIDGRYSINELILESNANLNTIGTQVNDYLSELIETKEFKSVKTQTENSILVIKNEWDKNYTFTNSYIKSIGINFNGEFTIYLIHPSLRAGSYKGKNIIVWSNQTYWPNYNTVYLWHEILHSYFGKSDLEHALIELITDEEMRIKLNGGEYPPFVGHKFLNDIKLKNLNIWKKYLKNNQTQIFELLKHFKT